MSNLAQQNLFDIDQDTFISFKGYEFNRNDQKWVLDINKTMDITRIWNFDSSTQMDVIQVLIHFARFSSSSHTVNMCEYVGKYWEITSLKRFTLEGLLNYKNFYSSKNDEYKVAMLRVFLKKIYDLGYSAVDDQVYDLIDSWRLSGNEKGAAVLSLDPDEGPFSPFEFQAIVTRTNEYLAENKLSLYEAALIKVFCATGRRPIQIASLKVKDLYLSNKYKLNNGEYPSVLNIPKAKMRGNSFFRAAFSEVGIRENLAEILYEHIKILRMKVAKLSNRELSELEFKELPLFYSVDKLTALDWNRRDLLEILSSEIVHLPTSDVTYKLKAAVGRLGIRSRETGKPIHITAYRFRYTLGTNAARQKAGINVIAKLLDHSDTQNASCYVESVPELAEQISVIMDESLRKYADAFQGKIVKDEIEAQIKVKDANRISCVEQDCSVGSCGTHNVCRDHAPIACYVCNKFMPWANAPHHLILTQLIEEREYLVQIGVSVEILAINDRVILAVQQVIDACKELNHG
ncbi:site-specific integrase [Acinetobacter sp. YH12069]|uniref:site-specific integrase n=1 Tax=Acinetobacter sp. YH12069 TaxID=2601065 RepID=UPI0015D19BD8|nr:site-specific integrase [Acinetobacter sp. YH12069]